MPHETAPRYSFIGSFLISLDVNKKLTDCFKAINAPEIDAVRVPPSAWITSQSMLIWFSPNWSKSITDLNDLPISLWISWAQEIQRLIGRSLRSVIDLDQLGENQISIDCDVIQADGGTRTASISGAFIALKQSVNFLLTSKEIKKDPIKEYLGAVSCGIYRGKPILDLDYKEDSAAEADANFVITDKNKIIEIQATAEQYPFSEKMFLELMMLAKSGIEEIIKKQKDVLEN